jgi:hypothetical protein
VLKEDEMIDFFDRLFTKIENRNKFLSKLKFYAALRFGIKSSLNIIAPIYFFLTKDKIEHLLVVSNGYKNNSPEVIVSLTSFPARIKRVWLVIETILRQTQKPDKIILWLSVDQFPSVYDLPSKLLNQMKRGLDIRLVDGDIKSHKKYYYALKEFPEDYILLIDDDIFYRSTMIEDLFRYAQSYPSAVIAQYCSQIKWVHNKLAPYSTWPNIIKEEVKNSNLFFGSGGGTLFPPKSLHADVLNEERFMLLTPTADDIWLNTMCRLNGTKVIKTSYFSHYLTIIHFGSDSLDSINNGNEKNESQLASIRNYYRSYFKTDPFFQDFLSSNEGGIA